ncbi:uncharacterized protein LOC121042451 isoform X2 [Herpailurus yagouaroundi]|uniref:uncharacterized protein LOC121042451 isoform X2 n=1 Tax=Herpailurus yagouaroundi TaxID=1608482 RepID=UPI001AD73B11|nr:uncharacterized protein LOC121042451 isoform X2 [Puma yagouaroundi]
MPNKLGPACVHHQNISASRLKLVWLVRCWELEPGRQQVLSDLWLTSAVIICFTGILAMGAVGVGRGYLLGFLLEEGATQCKRMALNFAGTWKNGHVGLDNKERIGHALDSGKNATSSIAWSICILISTHGAKEEPVWRAPSFSNSPRTPLVSSPSAGVQLQQAQGFPKEERRR